MGSRRSKARLSDERGVVAVFVVLCVLVLLAMIAFVVDLGNLFRISNELQNSADSAALAGAQELDGTVEGVTQAREKVKEFALMHLANNTDVVVNDNDIVFGHWHFVANDYCSPVPCFQPLDVSPGSENARVVNAVQVITRRAQSTQNPVSLFFGSFVNQSQVDVSSVAIAVGGGPYTECGFPMVMADCALQNAVPGGEGEMCDYCMRMQDATNDNAGWTTFQETGGVDGPDIADLIRKMCYTNPNNQNSDIDIDENGECGNACTQTTVGDNITVGNGNGMNTGNQNFCPVIQRVLTRGVDGGPAIPFRVKVPIIETGQIGTTCNPQFSGSNTIVGYATVVFYGAKCSSNDPEVRVTELPALCTSKPDWPPPSGKYIIAALDCGLNSDQAAGGMPGSIDSKKIRLVQ